MADAFKFPDETDTEVKTDTVDNFEVEVLDDTPDKDKNRKPLTREVAEPTDEELAQYSEGVQKRIKDLTHKAHDERRAKEATIRERDEALRVAQQLLEERNKLAKAHSDGVKQYADVSKTAAAAAVDAAKRKLKEAHEAFDAEAIASAQDELVMARMNLAKAENISAPTGQTDENAVQQQVSVRQTPQPDAKTQRWTAKNQWFGAPGYEEVTSYALGLHNKLVSSGVSPQSDEYFATIDANVKKRFSDILGGTEEVEVDTAQKAPATVVASVSRATGPKKITLTKTQVALATKLGLTPQQYAAQVAKLESKQ